MEFTAASMAVYMMMAVFGLMIIDFLLAFFKSFWMGAFSPSIVLDYLKDIVYYVLPLNILVSMMSIDPTGWILLIFYYIGGLAVIIKYAMDIVGKIKMKS